MQTTTRRKRRAAVIAALIALVAALLALRWGQGEPQVAAPAPSAEPDVPAEVTPSRPRRDAVHTSTAPAAAASANDPCPRALPSSGSRCTVADGEALICAYPLEWGDVTCRCQAGADVPATWDCVADRDRPRPARCPTQQPRTGDACPVAGIGCLYNPGLDGTGCHCKHGKRPTWNCMPYLEFVD